MGLLGGLLAFAPAMGALAGVLITLPDLAGPSGRIELVCALVVACVAPVLLFGRPLTVPLAADPEAPANANNKRPDKARRSFVSMWLARLLVQIAEAALFAFLFVYFRSVKPDIGEGSIARLFCFVLVAAVPIALFAGRWADRTQRPFFPLAIAATLSGIGLIVLSLSRDIDWAMAGYILFGLATTVFLSLHSGQTLRVLLRPNRRGRDLGIFNLTNTVPSLIMPWLTLALVPSFGFAGLFAVLALLAFTSATILFALPRN
jgi:MFS family permease